MKPTTHLFVSFALALTTTSACIDEFGIDSDIYENSCPPENCGHNTDSEVSGQLIDPIIYGTTSATRTGKQGRMGPSDKAIVGVDLLSMTKNGIAYSLELDNGSIGGRPFGGGQDISGAGVIGSVLEVQHGLLHAEIVIDDVVDIDNWVLLNPHTYPAYVMRYRDLANPNSPYVDFCPGGNAAFAVWGAYDQEGPVPSNLDQFTFACDGDAVFKMRRLGYDPQEANTGYVTTDDHRLATLNMITARYCDPVVGTNNFTTVGTAYRYQNSQDWIVVGSPLPAVDSSEVEALWDEDGAMCLNEPRVVARSTVTAVCGWLPRCDTGGTFKFYEWVTYHPENP